MRKRDRSRVKYPATGKGPRCSWGCAEHGARGTKLERNKRGSEGKGRGEETSGHRPLTQINANATVRREGDSIVDSISEASSQLAPSYPVRRLRGYGSLNMKYAPLIIHGYSLLYVSFGQGGLHHSHTILWTSFE